MNILIHAHRIIAVDRWRFFAQKMMGFGHEVRAITSNLHNHRPLLEAGFTDVGIKHIYKPEELNQAIDDFKPDFVCGEIFSPDEVTGRTMIELANQKLILTLLQQHQVNTRAGMYRNHASWEHAHLFCATVENAKLCGTGDMPWPPARTYTFGNWEHDELLAVKAPASIQQVHESLEINGRKLIAVFSNSDDSSYWLPWVDANDEWLIVVHPHPVFRRAANGKGKQCFLNRVDENYPAYHEANKRGAIFCVDHLPGTLDGIEIKQIHKHHLILAADVILSGSPDICWDAYILGKKTYVFGTHPNWRRVHPAYSSILDTSRFFGENTNFVEKVNEALSEPSGIVQDWEMLEDRYRYIDGRWWERTYNFAKELINDSLVPSSKDGV